MRLAITNVQKSICTIQRSMYNRFNTGSNPVQVPNFSGKGDPMYGLLFQHKGCQVARARNFRLPLWAVSILALTLAVSYPPANAQVVFGSLVGNVTDATGGAIVGATVK